METRSDGKTLCGNPHMEWDAEGWTSEGLHLRNERISGLSSIFTSDLTTSDNIPYITATITYPAEGETRVTLNLYKSNGAFVNASRTFYGENTLKNLMTQATDSSFICFGTGLSVKFDEDYSDEFGKNPSGWVVLNRKN
jgi:hypothetical protein